MVHFTVERVVDFFGGGSVVQGKLSHFCSDHGILGRGFVFLPLFSFKIEVTGSFEYPVTFPMMGALLRTLLIRVIYDPKISSNFLLIFLFHSFLSAVVAPLFTPRVTSDRDLFFMPPLTPFFNSSKKSCLMPSPLVHLWWNVAWYTCSQKRWWSTPTRNTASPIDFLLKEG